MKAKLYLPLLALAASLTFPAIASAHEHDKSATPAEPAAGQLVEPTEKDAAWLAKARAAYPLKTCVVSDDEIGGSMGEPIERIYRQAGQPDRLLRFCCKDCPADFAKEPAKYLKLLDAAASKATSAATSYACPMHADVTSTKAGEKCPKCGMALVATKPQS